MTAGLQAMGPGLIIAAMKHFRLFMSWVLVLALGFGLLPGAGRQAGAAQPLRVLVWDEQQPEQQQAYGKTFLGGTLAAHLAKQPGLVVHSVRMDDAQQGLSDALLDEHEVLVFWSHRRVRQQDDARAEAVVQRVMQGRLGLVALHSAHWAKPFVRLMQERAKADALASLPAGERATARWELVNEAPYSKMVGRAARLTPFVEKGDGGTWRLMLPACVFPVYRNDGQPSHVRTLLPEHPIAAGLPQHWDIARTEMYGEPFHVPPPDALIFEERWDKGEHFRSGCLWTVGKGQVFYFRPGHETYPIFQQAECLRVVENAVRWVNPKRPSP